MSRHTRSARADPRGATGSARRTGRSRWRFHATFQAALNDEFEALVRDLRTAAAAVADPRHDDPDAADAPARAVSASEEHGSTSAVVSELVARWTFILAAYRAHVAAEDEVVLLALPRA